MIALPRAPTTPAGALALTIADGRATLAREDAVDRFEGTEWHRPKPAGADTPSTCAVCAPSSVMAGTKEALTPQARGNASEHGTRNGAQARTQGQTRRNVQGGGKRTIPLRAKSTAQPRLCAHANAQNRPLCKETPP